MAFALAYVALDWLTYLHPVRPFAATPWNPQAALAVAIVALAGMRFAPAVLAAAVLGEWMVRAPSGLAWGWPLATASVAVVYVAAGLAVRRWRAALAHDNLVQRLSWLLLLCAACAALAASAYSGVRWAAGDLGDMPFAALLGRLAIGDLLGLVVTMPLLLLLGESSLAHWQVQPFAKRVLAREIVLLVVSFAVLLVLVFTFHGFDTFRTSYLLFLPLVVVAMRHGLPGAALAAPLAQIGLLAAFALFPVHSDTPFEFQLLMLSMAVTTLYLGALASERAGAMRALARRDAEIRERQQAVGAALRAAAASEVAASLAHELNQPLSAIGTYARACREMAADLPKNREALGATLEKVSRESARAGAMVRRMREFFRSGALRLAPTTISGLVAAALDHVSDRCAREGIELRRRSLPTPATISVDPVQMTAVLVNLLNNALDALRGVPPVRWIELCVSAPDLASIRIDVEDNGPGIAVEVRERLFEPFATSKAEGMGLGLAMSRSIVEAHGGSLWMDGSSRSTRFSILLPVHA